MEGQPQEGRGRGRGFGRGRGEGRGRGRGEGRGRGRGEGRGGPGKAGEPKKQWVPVTKLGRLVMDGKITSLEEVFLFSMPIKEVEIVEHFLGEDSQAPNKLKDEVMKILPVQKQTAAGQRTRFKAIVCVGDYNGHVGLGSKVAKEVATAIRGALIDAKMCVVPIRRGFWGSKMGQPHTVPTKVTGKCGSVRVRLLPAPHGSGLVCGRVPKKILTMSGLTDVFTSSRGKTRTVCNFLKATFHALRNTYEYLTPDLWQAAEFPMQPFQKYSEDLAKKVAEKHTAAAAPTAATPAPTA